MKPARTTKDLPDDFQYALHLIGMEQTTMLST
jgi:hypothetical protein